MVIHIVFVLIINTFYPLCNRKERKRKSFIVFEHVEELFQIIAVQHHSGCIECHQHSNQHPEVQQERVFRYTFVIGRIVGHSYMCVRRAGVVVSLKVNIAPAPHVGQTERRQCGRAARAESNYRIQSAQGMRNSKYREVIYGRL